MSTAVRPGKSPPPRTLTPTRPAFDAGRVRFPSGPASGSAPWRYGVPRIGNRLPGSGWRVRGRSPTPCRYSNQPRLITLQADGTAEYGVVPRFTGITVGHRRPPSQTSVWAPGALAAAA